MKGTFYTTKYLITVNNEQYEYNGEEISYGKRLPSEFIKQFTKEELKNAINNGLLHLKMYDTYVTPFQGDIDIKRTYLNPYSSRFLIGGIDITDSENIEIKFVFKKIKCNYTIDELKNKLTAEEYIDMIQIEGLNNME